MARPTSVSAKSAVGAGAELSVGIVVGVQLQSEPYLVQIRELDCPVHGIVYAHHYD
jgi:hypothetical protein